MDESASHEDVRVSTMEETDRKCPACGGGMGFSPRTGGLKCPYCEYEQAIPAALSGDADAPVSAMEQDFYSAEETGNCDWGVEKKSVTCKSCGAESVYDALQVAGECPYCGSNQVMEAAGKKTLAPGGVCIFKIDVKTAGANFKQWLSKKWFCPGDAKRKAEPEAFRGIYLPYWTFDADTTSNYSGRYGHYRTRKTKNGSSTYTEWHSTSGVHMEFIDDELVSGIDPNRRDMSIFSLAEPFNTADNLLYKPEYVAGFVAERYSVGLRDAWEKAKGFIAKKLRRSVGDKIKRENHADTSQVNSIVTAYSNIKYKYLLLPVWVSAFKHNDKMYQFVVNGQTGKVGGHAPVSVWRVAIAVILALAAASVIYWLSHR
jgi:ssDNA-binding Zn-finger/Zn-ribbon topoisomerase 1